MKIVSAKVMRAIDRSAIKDYGIKGLVLMENAGRGVAEVVIEELESCVREGRRAKVSILCGKGNNGGDGFVIARHLANNKVDAIVFVLGSTKDIKGDARANLTIWNNMGGEALEIKSTRTLKKFASKIRHSDIIVDAIFGTGLTTDVRGVCKDAIELINKSKKPIVSVDIPSGIDATTGRLLGRAVRADITATMALAKLGSVIYPGRDYTGELILVDIGLPSQLIEDPSIEWNLIDVDTVKDTLRPRSADTHKGSYGHVLTIGGAIGKDGAPIMTGMSAASLAMAVLKSGAGLSTVAMAKSLINNTKLELEVMGLALSEESDGTLGKASLEDSINAFKGKSVLVFGPGLGAVSLDYAEGLLAEATSKKIPVVIDADGLNLFKGKTALLKKFTDKGLKAVLTPHPGEAARLLGVTVKVVEADRLGAAKELSSKTGTVVVLKGSATIVYADGETYINTSGNAGMGTAGAGDVLAGMVGALVGQGYTLREAATVGVYMHGLAGDLAVVKTGQTSLTATDIIDFIPSAFEGVLKETKCCG